MDLHGVHGAPVELPLQDLWISDIAITLGLVDTIAHIADTKALEVVIQR